MKVVPTPGHPQTWPISISAHLLAPFPDPTMHNMHICHKKSGCVRKCEVGARCVPLAILAPFCTLLAGKWCIPKLAPILPHSSEVQHAHSDNAPIPHYQVLYFRAFPLNSSWLLLLLCTAHVRSCKIACIFVRPPSMYESGALSHRTFQENEAPSARDRLPIG